MAKKEKEAEQKAPETERSCDRDCTGPDDVCPNLLPDFGCKLDQDEAGQTAKEPDLLDDLPDPCVYCGPTVKNVARQYTTYQGGGIPKALRDFILAHPAARGLITSTGKFAAMRKRLETPGTAEAILYKTVKNEI